MDRSALTAVCKRFKGLIRIPKVPLTIKIMAPYKQLINQINYHFNNSVREISDVIPRYLDRRIPKMFVNLKFENVFLHLVLCGRMGCYLCRPVQQWNHVVPESFYYEFLHLFTFMDLDGMDTPDDIFNHLCPFSPFRLKKGRAFTQWHRSIISNFLLALQPKMFLALCILKTEI